MNNEYEEIIDDLKSTIVLAERHIAHLQSEIRWLNDYIKASNAVGDELWNALHGTD